MSGEPEFPPSKRTSFREQVMEGKVPIGYNGLVSVPNPGVALAIDNALAKSRDVTPERVAYLMREPSDG